MNDAFVKRRGAQLFFARPHTAINKGHLTAQHSAAENRGLNSDCWKNSRPIGVELEAAGSCFEPTEKTIVPVHRKLIF